MVFPIDELVKGSKNKQAIKLLLLQASKAFISWETIWSEFISAPIKEEFLEKVNILEELRCYSDGGYPNAERHRICFSRVSNKAFFSSRPVPLKGLNIQGNFLFDRAQKSDFRKSLEGIGASSKEIGDIWLKGDRGAQVICTPEVSLRLNGKTGMVRNVEIHCESLQIDQLTLPATRLPKRFKSVEASKRLDAIASAGFGMSRGKIAKQIKLGRLRLNWEPIKLASRLVLIGDRIQLEDKGSLEILNIQQTNRGRWRVELLRQ